MKKRIIVALLIAGLGFAAASNVESILSTPVLRSVSLWLCQPSKDIYYGSFPSDQIWRIDERGLAQPTDLEEGLRNGNLSKSPDGKFLAYTEADDHPQGTTWRVRVACADGTRPYTVAILELRAQSEAWAGWLNSDTLSYGYDDFDPKPGVNNVKFDMMEIWTGRPVALDDLAEPTLWGYEINPRNPNLVSYLKQSGKYHWLENGDYYWLLDRRSGQRTPILYVPKFGEVHGAWSPDGRYLAFSMGLDDRNDDRDGQIFLYDRETLSIERMTNLWRSGTSNIAHSIRWSPDGRWIAFGVHRFVWDLYDVLGTYDPALFPDRPALRDMIEPDALYVLSIDQREPVDLGVRVSHQRGSSGFSFVWSPDSRQIAFTPNYEGEWDIFTVAIGSKEIRRLTHEPDHIKYSLAW